jgi:4a-hydroxytetrahydrobiopterin dehydratase
MNRAAPPRAKPGAARGRRSIKYLAAESGAARAAAKKQTRRPLAKAEKSAGGRTKNKNHEHFDYYFNHPDHIADRRAAGVALQWRLGLLSQRRFGIGRADFGDSFAARIFMTSEPPKNEPLKGDALRHFKSQLSGGWHFADEQRLEKQFKFPDFRKALDFTNRVSEIAEQQGHHPDIFLTYGEVRLQIWTHQVNGLTENDFVFAAKVDGIG